MPQLRRRFLQQLGLAAAASLALGKVSAATRAIGIAPVVKSGLGYSAFLPQVGHDFTAMRAASPTATLRLVEIVQLANVRGYPDPFAALEQCFTLVFENQTKARLPEGIYSLSAGKFAAFDAFVSPIRGDNRSYQAVFNRV
ncbi:MAG: hypothetical protein ABIS07_13910 [Dokdonella sp.]